MTKSMTVAAKKPKSATKDGVTERGLRYLIRWKDSEGRSRGATFADEKSARGALADVRADLANGRGALGGGMTLGQAWGQFTKVKTTSGKKWRESTGALYAETWGHVPESLRRMKLIDVNADDVAMWQGGLLDARGLAVSTVRLHTIRLGAVFSWAKKRKYIASSPTSDDATKLEIKPRVIQPEDVPSMAELLAIRAELPESLRVVVLLGVLGLRAGEIRGLRVGDLDFSVPGKPKIFVRQQLVRNRTRKADAVAKGAAWSAEKVSDVKQWRSDRKISIIATELVAPIMAHLDALGIAGDPDAYVLQKADGRGALDYNYLDYYWTKAKAAAGLERFKIHSMRHHAGVALADRGVPAVEAAHQLGHSVQTYSAIYLNRSQGADDRARQAMSGHYAGFAA